MKELILGLRFSFSYFTIFPITFNSDDDLSNPIVLRNMLLFFPFVGIILSLLVVSIYLLLPQTWLMAILCSILYIIFYGFIHTEAIADVMDALYATFSGKDGYKIIKEPTIGAMGVLYSVSFLILKVVALSYILKSQMFVEFVAIATISRLTLLFVIYFYSFKSSFINSLKDSFKNDELKIVSIVYGVFLFFALSFSLINYIFIAMFIAIVLIYIVKKRLKFLNGDVLGLILEMIELSLIIWV